MQCSAQRPESAASGFAIAAGLLQVTPLLVVRDSSVGSEAREGLRRCRRRCLKWWFLESGWCQQPDPTGESPVTTAKPSARYGAI
jgi:hypothetical protein